MGKGPQYTDRFAIKGHKSPKILANVELKPTAWLLRFVGKSSAVIVQTKLNAHPEAHLPIKKNMKMAVVCWKLSFKLWGNIEETADKTVSSVEFSRLHPLFTYIFFSVTNSF